VTRAEIKKLKKSMQTGASTNASEMQKSEAQAAALELLRRSVALKHDQLAILRLVDALKLDATVDSNTWNYCSAVANTLTNQVQLQTLLNTFVHRFPSLHQ
jgi:hypothetical protein